MPVEEDAEDGGDADRRGPGHQGSGKGLSKEQKNGLDMVKHIMLSLDEEDGLDQIYTLRLEGSLSEIGCLCLSYLHVLYTPTSKSGDIISCRNAVEQLRMFKCIERRPMAWPCQLTISNTLSIRIVGYKAVS